MVLVSQQRRLMAAFAVAALALGERRPATVTVVYVTNGWQHTVLTTTTSATSVTRTHVPWRWLRYACGASFRARVNFSSLASSSHAKVVDTSELLPLTASDDVVVDTAATSPPSPSVAAHDDRESLLTAAERQSMQSLLTLVDQTAATIKTSTIDSSDAPSNKNDFSPVVAIVADEDFRHAVLEAMQSTLSPNVIVKLRQYPPTSTAIRMDDALFAETCVAFTIQALIEDQMLAARTTLASLLEAGEIRKLDAAIGKAARDQRLNAAFFQVLTLNLQHAMAVEQPSEDDVNATPAVDSESKSPTLSRKKAKDNPFLQGQSASQRQILQHIYTRCQEEMENLLPPATAFLNKLMRTDSASIRFNLYEHYLSNRSTPARRNSDSSIKNTDAPSVPTLTTPDGRVITLNKALPSQSRQATPSPPRALIDMSDFVEAMASAVQQIRMIETAGAVDRVTAAGMVEDCRQIAAEARRALWQTAASKVADASQVASNDSIDSWTEQQLQVLEDGLQPVFRPLSPESPYITGYSL